ncbi:hypothetical protein AB0M57_23855 [Streptomyces sp. NPDC051597]|uniref:hypothetical protein n=1 Tax=Streptomyces sp. NPDC051597 TaxID=3155049 RepID=UPI003434164E
MSRMKRYAEDVREVQEAAGLAGLHDTPLACLKAIRETFELCGTLARYYHDPLAVSARLTHEAVLFYAVAVAAAPRAARVVVAA